jgi:hypothetical protein
MGQNRFNREVKMAPDVLLLMVASLGFAAVFLALVIAMTNSNAEDIVSTVSSMSPSARRQAKMERLNDMTRLADEAIEARRLGRRINSHHDF